MNVRDLKIKLEGAVPKTKVNPLMTSISHWVKAVFDAPKGHYSANTLSDIETLEKLSDFGIISLRKGSGEAIIAELTQDGKELYRDFTGMGYYL